MAKPARAPQSYRCFFITSSTWERRRLFQSEPMAKLFLQVLFHYRRERKFLLHEFVLMQDHFHLLITPDSTLSLERAVQFVKGGYSFRASKELGFNGEIWQRGFADHLIRDAQDFQKHRSYIRDNPVVRGLVNRAEEYPYSSAHPGFELDLPAMGLKG
jgi:putative transposase